MIKRGTKVAGDYLDLAEKVKDAGGPITALFRITEFEDPEMGDFGAYKVPVIADVLICSGPEEGAVYHGERFFGAPSGPLRGVKNPKKGEKEIDILPPVNEIGDELAFRVSVKSERGSQAYVALDPPSDPEMDAIEVVYMDGKGWNGRELVGAGAPAKQRPWER